jgi:hypothetical protein
MRTYAPSVALLCVVSALASGAEPKPFPKRIAAQTVYLRPPIEGYYRITIAGDLNGKGELVLDRNSCDVTEFGDPDRCTEIAPKIVNVMIKDTGKPDPEQLGRKLYAIEGTGLRNPLLLVIYSGNDPRARLIYNDRGPESPRPITLEPLVYSGREAPHASKDEFQRGESISEPLHGAVLLQPPVPLRGPFPTLARMAEVGDKVILQVSYDERTENVVKVSTKVSNRAMSAIQVLNTQHRLYFVKNEPEPKDDRGPYFAVLLTTNSPGSCSVTVTAELADKTKKDVPFEFIITGQELRREAKTKAHAAATYRAEWDHKKLTVTASGMNPTLGWKNELSILPFDVYPPEFRFTQTPPQGIAAQLVTPFSVSITTEAATQIDHIFVTDSTGRYRVPVIESGDDPHAIPASAKAILEAATRLELLSLQPTAPDDQSKDDFHGWKVLGTKAVEDEKTREELVEVFEHGVAEYKGGPAKCFNPRHGIRVKDNGTTVDFVICFECFQVRLYTTGEKEKNFLVSRSPAELFNKILKEGGVALVKD